MILLSILYVMLPSAVLCLRWKCVSIQSPMKAIVEKELGLARASLRTMNAYAVPKSTSDRQKLLVAVMQEVVLLLVIVSLCFQLYVFIYILVFILHDLLIYSSC